jgi:hypothetical protein
MEINTTTIMTSQWEEKVHDIAHISMFLVLPSYEWGVSDWHLDVIKPFVKKHKPVIGFSLKEALYAKKVIVIGDEQQFPESDISMLRHLGCQVDRITDTGTSIATKLAERYP